MSSKGNVIYLHQLDPQAALARLNRLTGVQFSQWPQSLVPVHETLPVIVVRVDECAAVAEPLSYVTKEGCVRS